MTNSEGLPSCEVIASPRTSAPHNFVEDKKSAQKYEILEF
jgi:hypothetical protein